MNATYIFKLKLARSTDEELQNIATDLDEVKGRAFSRLSAVAKRQLNKEILLTQVEIAFRRNAA